MISYLLILIFLIEFLRKKYFNALQIFFFLLLEGYQLLPIEIYTFGFFSGTTIDAALLGFFLLFITKGKLWLLNKIKSKAFSRAIFAFIFILFLNMLYGISKGYAIGDIFKGARLYLFLLSFLMFTEIPGQTIIQVIKTLVIITFFLSLLFLLQVLTGKTILQGPKSLDMEDLNYIRFYNTPKLLDFSLAICLFWFPFKISKTTRILFIVVFILTVLAPLHRGYIFSWILTMGLYSLLFNNYLKKLLYTSLISVSIVILLTVDVFKARISEAMEQLSVLKNVFSGQIIYDSNTFIYRINHLSERLKYLNSHTFGWLFGIGLVDEKAPQAKVLPFQYGLPDPITGNIVKVYTPDLVWSMLFLTMGYVGALFFVNIFLQILWKYSRNPISTGISKVIFTLILIGLLSSFTSNTFLQPHFFIPIFMAIMMIEKKLYCIKN